MHRKIDGWRAEKLRGLNPADPAGFFTNTLNVDELLEVQKRESRYAFYSLQTGKLPKTDHQSGSTTILPTRNSPEKGLKIS